MARMAKGGTTIVYGYMIPARGKTNDRTYMNMIYNMNIERLEADSEKYQRGVPEKNKLNTREWFERTIKKAKIDYGTKGLKTTFKTLVEEKLAVDVSVLVDRTLEGLMTYFPNQMKVFYEVIAAEGEQFDPKKLVYIGGIEGVYEYITNTYKPIIINMRNSPYEIEIYMKGERIA